MVLSTDGTVCQGISQIPVQGYALGADIERGRSASEETDVSFTAGLVHVLWFDMDVKWKGRGDGLVTRGDSFNVTTDFICCHQDSEFN